MDEAKNALKPCKTNGFRAFEFLRETRNVFALDVEGHINIISAWVSFFRQFCICQGLATLGGALQP